MMYLETRLDTQTGIPTEVRKKIQFVLLLKDTAKARHYAEMKKLMLLTNVGKTLMDSARAIVVTMQTYQTMLLRERTAYSRQTFDRMTLSLLVTVPVAIFGLGLIGMTLIRFYRADSAVQQELLNKQEFIESMVEAIPSIVYVYDAAKRKTTYSNLAIEKILGYPVRDTSVLTDEFIVSLLHADDLEGLEHGLAVICNDTNNDVHERTYRMLRQSGDWCWLSERVIPFKRNEDGTVAEFLAIASDITEQKQAEQAMIDLNARLEALVHDRTTELRSSEAHLRAVLESTTDCICAMDIHYNLTVCNTAFRNVFQQEFHHEFHHEFQQHSQHDVVDQSPSESLLTQINSPSEISGSVHRRLDLGLFAEWFAYYPRVMRGESVRLSDGHIVVNGQGMYFDTTLSPMYTPDGEIMGAAIFAHNITPRRRAEQEAEFQKQNAMGAVVRGQDNERQRIARDLHDGIGQMLSMVKLNLTALEEQIRETMPTQKYAVHNILATIDDAVQEIRFIAHDLMPATLSSFGLSAALRQMCSKLERRSMMQIAFDAFDMERRLEQHQEIGLYRIAQEALANAVRHSNASVVTVQLVGYDDSVVLVVEDNGHGFSTSALFPLSITPNTPFFGSGMGIQNMITRSQMLDGTCTVDSSSQTGTVITVEIPRTRLQGSPCTLPLLVPVINARTLPPQQIEQMT
jgi:PAS domain S-box-containing protein